MTNKILISLASILVVITSKGQTKNTLYLESSGGFEYNIYKNPNSYKVEDENIERSELLINAPFAGFRIEDCFTHQWKKQSLTILGSATARIYNKHDFANNISIFGEIKYQREISKKLKLDASYNYKQHSRKELYEIEGLYRYPIAYKEHKQIVDFDYRLSKNIHLRLLSSIRFRNYNEIPEHSNTKYKEMLIGLQLKKRFRISKGNYNYLYIKGNFTNRKYNKESYIFDDEDETINVSSKEVNWNYLRGELSYKFRLVENIKIKPGVKYEYRNDKTNNVYKYNQVAPYIKAYFKLKKHKFSLSCEERFRFYESNIITINGNNKKYQYVFGKYGVDYSYNFSDKFKMFISANSYIKQTNNSNTNKLSRRSYKYFLVKIGTKLTF